MDEQLIENILIYGLAGLLCLGVIFIYLRKQIRQTKKTIEKIEKAKRDGLYEPVSLHPVVDPNVCIKTGACIAACPEKDILGIMNGKATTVNASQCIGHGACFHACPTQAITLCIGTEKRGVDLPHVNMLFETTVPGIYIAGELGGMGLIKNAVEQGRQAVENISKALKPGHGAEYDLLIIGAGPAGISASLTAKKNKLRFITLEQDTLGGTVFTFPRSKIVMTAPMNIPLHGKVKLSETSKRELLDLWTGILSRHEITIRENARVESIEKESGHFVITTLNGDKLTAKNVLLAIGRRGTPRKLGIEGETLEKVAYRLLEPEEIAGKDILVVGGGDSAIESALLLAEKNRVTLSYRGDSFGRIKPKNNERIQQAAADNKVKLLFGSNPLKIEEEAVLISTRENAAGEKVKNNMVYIFAGGELPTEFLKKTGIEITRKFGEAILKHK